jgi:hypothetical protein
MKESEIHNLITDWIKETYPTVIFNTDSSGIKLNAGQAGQMKKLRSSNGFPDITIYEDGDLGSILFLEVKKESPYKVNGDLKKNEHYEEQDQMHIALKGKGYHAQFVWTLEMAQEVIKKHLSHINTYHG